MASSRRGWRMCRPAPNNSRRWSPARLLWRWWPKKALPRSPCSRRPVRWSAATSWPCRSVRCASAACLSRSRRAIGAGQRLRGELDGIRCCGGRDRPRAFPALRRRAAKAANGPRRGDSRWGVSNASQRPACGRSPESSAGTGSMREAGCWRSICRSSMDAAPISAAAPAISPAASWSRRTSSRSSSPISTAVPSKPQGAMSSIHVPAFTGRMPPSRLPPASISS